MDKSKEATTPMAEFAILVWMKKGNLLTKQRTEVTLVLYSI